MIIRTEVSIFSGYKSQYDSCLYDMRYPFWLSLNTNIQEVKWTRRSRISNLYRFFARGKMVESFTNSETLVLESQLYRDSEKFFSWCIFFIFIVFFYYPSRDQFITHEIIFVVSKGGLGSRERTVFMSYLFGIVIPFFSSRWSSIKWRFCIIIILRCRNGSRWRHYYRSSSSSAASSSASSSTTSSSASSRRSCNSDSIYTRSRCRRNTSRSHNKCCCLGA